MYLQRAMQQDNNNSIITIKDLEARVATIEERHIRSGKFWSSVFIAWAIAMIFYMIVRYVVPSLR